MRSVDLYCLSKESFFHTLFYTEDTRLRPRIGHEFPSLKLNRQRGFERSITFSMENKYNRGHFENNVHSGTLNVLSFYWLHKSFISIFDYFLGSYVQTPPFSLMRRSCFVPLFKVSSFTISMFSSV